ncbi:hypothetical protein [Sphaerisporangium fuscum]|uniref:hypothetical protein n=1 Tax=Sphaerisporangium fuscum TaxID=2835868 RepID=UPI001BDD8778|nr:hypothetical protein [Sphaerisporangium fuscum]
MTEMLASESRRKQLLRKPLLLALAFAIVLVTGFVLLNRDDYEQADLRFVTSQIQKHKVQSATIRDEQRIEITTIDGRRFHAELETPSQAAELANALQKAQPAEGYSVSTSTTLFPVLFGPLVLGIFMVGALVAVLVAVPRRAKRFQRDH